MNLLCSRYVILLATALAVTLLVPLALGGTGLLDTLAIFPGSQLVYMLGLVLVCWNLNALRLRLLLAGRAGHLGQCRAVAMVMATEFAICATPGGSGGPVTLLALLARRGLRPARASAIFMVDQLSDLLFFLIAMLGVITHVMFSTLEWQYEGLVGLSTLSLLILLLASWWVIRHLPVLLRLGNAFLIRLGIPLQRRRGLGRHLLHFRHALQVTLQLPRSTLTAIFTLCAMHWLLRYSVLYLAIQGLGASLDWGWTFMVQMLSMAAGQLSLLPGGAGGAELTSSALLIPSIGQQQATAAVTIWRFVTYHFYLLAGAPAFLTLAGRILWRPA
ncbi:hypothetical protein L861_09550 [Litchfieldella anticariensis FP35 = DSM 16096]|uniref:TIGR00374 family protein n=1 Tax=Litchfieldella anticariensis (strain DSM 16096 / CECT 5854 / CIP 108499 / LMG 22089 / FP35) TaxID=1121939 RepID=S2L4D2_LITA3|nr:lysylphosphatidylglycerol synthase transmembrane domain-containing protein [Halomonas anticariensis]EPC02579.1 hypothetical protein L861_09550 [Halomonas anticariensis FP35 = DSM 16096]